MAPIRSRRTRRTFLKSALLALGALSTGSLLAACQQAPAAAPKADPKPAEAPKPTAAPAAPAAAAKPTEAAKPAAQAPQAAPAAAAKPGGSTVWTAEVDPVTLDPWKSSNFSSAQAWGDLTYQSLTMFDENLKVIPGLAESWTNPDPTTWIFKLRQGVKFHDGSELEAEDVVFWHEKLMAAETAAPYKNWFEHITKAEAQDKYTVKMTLSAPHAPMLIKFAAMRGSSIAPRKWAAGGDMAKQAVGTGPFKIVEYVPQSHIRYVKHADYWEQGLPLLDEVTFKVATDEETRLAGLRSGQVQHAALSPEAAERIANDKNIVVMSSPGPQMWTHLFNTKQAPFDDVRVRQAIFLALDRQAAIEKALNGQGTLTGPMPTGHGDWFIPPEKLPYRKDVARAKELLAEAGHPNGFKTTIKTTPDYPVMLSTSIILADQIKEIGIQAELIQMEWGALVKDIQGGSFDIHSNGTSFFPDPDSYLYQQHSKAVNNYTKFSNEKYDALVEQAKTIMEPAERKKLYDEAQQILLDQPPYINWFTSKNIEALHVSQKGYAQSFTGRRIFLKKVSVEK
jgi:peptide/nickel transport system substrate-binding protein